MQEVFSNIIEKLEVAGKTELIVNGGRCNGKTLALGYTKGISDAIEIVKQEAEQYNNGWIPCSERLPEKNGMYICTQNSYDLETNKNIIRVSTELVEFYNGKWRRAKTLVVTHWQPLPQPYTKGE